MNTAQRIAEFARRAVQAACEKHKKLMGDDRSCICLTAAELEHIVESIEDDARAEGA